MSEEQDKTDPSAPKHSPDKGTNQVLMAISEAIFNRIGPMVAGTLKQTGPAELAPIDEGFLWLRIVPAEVSRLLGSGPAEADLAAAVAMFPAGMHALITAHVDARVHVFHSADSLEVSISQSNEPEFLFAELEESYDATHALHLVCDPAKDADYTFVMLELRDGKFTPMGWVDGEAAARYATEGAKSAKGRLPDFYGTTGKLPK
jgi:hypothetical protein